MRVPFITALLAGLALASLPSAADDGPPLEDGWCVEHRACPGECYRFGEWQVAADTPLYDRPRSRDQVGLARKGDRVTALTGDSYAVPLPIDVIHAPQSAEAYAEEPDGEIVALDFAAGQRIYLLTYVGEGYSWIWVEGRLAQLFAEDLYARDGAGGWQVCDPPSAACWWRIDLDLVEPPSEWWIHLRLPDGTEGWTRDDANFTDICRM